MATSKIKHEQTPSYTQLGTTAFYYRRLGNIVEFRYSDINASISVAVTLGTLPSGYRPSADLRFGAAINTSETSQRTPRLNILASGKVQIDPWGSYSGILQYNGVYLV